MTIKPKLIRITTVPISLEKLLENQLTFMSKYCDVTAISSDKKRLAQFDAILLSILNHKFKF